MPKLQITHVAIRNICGARHVEIAFPQNRTIIAGGNMDGKSSLRDAIALALTKIPSRVEPTKKAMAGLITEGAKNGTVSVGITMDGEPMASTFALPKLEGISPRLEEPQASCLPLVLNPSAFPEMKANDRRKIIQILFGIGAGGDISKRLEEEGLPADKIEPLKALLVTGFDAAADFASAKAAESRAAWKAITGENYGSLKGGAWKAPKPEVDAEALAMAITRRAQLDAGKTALMGQLAVIAARNDDASSAETHRGRLTALVADTQRRKELLDYATKELDEFRPTVEDMRRRAEARRPQFHEITHRLAVDLREALQVTGTESSALAEYDAAMDVIPDPDAQTKLPDYEKSLAVLERMFSNRTNEYAESKNAAVILSELPPPGTPEDTSVLSEQINSICEELAGLNSYILRAQAQQTLFSVADENTAKAAKHHQDVTDWVNAARLLGPDGIPAEYMAKALQQINRGMASHALIMQEYDPKWPAVTISPDMDVLANGRPYGLLSESEKWRCGFLLALAIASISGLEFFVADRMDVLEVNARDAVINWMDTTAINGIQVIALGTFKQPLRGLPATITTQWIQDGTLVDAEAAAA